MGERESPRLQGAQKANVLGESRAVSSRHDLPRICRSAPNLPLCPARGHSMLERAPVAMTPEGPGPGDGRTDLPGAPQEARGRHLAVTCLLLNILLPGTGECTGKCTGKASAQSPHAACGLLWGGSKLLSRLQGPCWLAWLCCAAPGAPGGGEARRRTHWCWPVSAYGWACLSSSLSPSS